MQGKGFPVDRIPADSHSTVYMFATGSGISPIKALIESGDVQVLTFWYRWRAIYYYYCVSCVLSRSMSCVYISTGVAGSAWPCMCLESCTASLPGSVT